MRSWKKMSIGLKAAVVATVILALSIVGVLASERFQGAPPDPAPKTDVKQDAALADDDLKAASKALELGTAAKVSPNYRVTVTAVSRYETSTGGQLFVPTVKATYIGKGDGEPWGDLNVELYVSGSPTLGESDCPFDLGDEDPAKQPTLKTDEEATYAVCIPVPTKDTKGGKISVEEAFSSDHRTFWSTTGAVTKPLPSAAPELPAAKGGQAGGSQPRRNYGNNSGSNDACDKFDEDDYEEYKEWGDDRKRLYEKYKDRMDDDDIDDYKEWEDAYDDQIDRMDELHDVCD